MPKYNEKQLRECMSCQHKNRKKYLAFWTDSDSVLTCAACRYKK